MTLRAATFHGEHFIWDEARVAEPHAGLFESGWWRERGALIGEAEGRGAAYMLHGPDDDDWVLRHSYRGGVLARINSDRFLYTGAERTRPFRELRMLASLRDKGLAVPAPIAARVQPALGFYRGDLITVRIPGATTLADRLAREPIPATRWQRLGGILARFHAAGVWHADLNARNVLIDDQDAFYLLDFDKARLRNLGKWREANLMRLRRSLDKFRESSLRFNFMDADWAALRGGYASVFAAGL